MMSREIKQKLLEQLMGKMSDEESSRLPKKGGMMLEIGIHPMGKEAELEKGEEVEMEHTDDEDEAEEIAKEHLKETPDYYSRLQEAGLADGEEDDEEIDPRLAEILKKKRMARK